MIQTHSNTGALSHSDPRFCDAIRAAQTQLLAAVVEFERATGRTVDGLSMQWIDVTQLNDAQPTHMRIAHLSWLPMPGEFD